jgi:hypothetical protein
MSTSKRAFVCFFSIAFGLLVTALPGHAQFWEKKDWREWSKGECEKLLTNSPWARRFADKQVSPGAPRQPSRSGGSVGAQDAEGTADEIEYVVQIRSARPIRQAVVRMAQLHSEYDKMTPEQKKKFDEQAEPYISQDFSNRIVFHVYYSTNQERYEKEMDRQWRAQQAPRDTALHIARGEPVPVAEYIRAQEGAREFELIFPKDHGGAPILSEQDKKLTLQLPPVGFRRIPIKVEFDPRKMTLAGKLEH